MWPILVSLDLLKSWIWPNFHETCFYYGYSLLGRRLNIILILFFMLHLPDYYRGVREKRGGIGEITVLWFWDICCEFYWNFYSTFGYLCHLWFLFFCFFVDLVHVELPSQPGPSCPWVGWATASSESTQRTKTPLWLCRTSVTLCLEVSPRSAVYYIF